MVSKFSIVAGGGLQSLIVACPGSLFIDFFHASLKISTIPEPEHIRDISTVFHFFKVNIPHVFLQSS